MPGPTPTPLKRHWPQRHLSPWLHAAAWLLALFLLARFAVFLREAAVRPSHGFAAYYTASRLVAEGADASQFYDNDWFMAQIQRFQPLAADVHINPPSTNLLLLPLVRLDYTGARMVWTAFSLLCLAGATGYLLWSLDFRGPWVPAGIAFTLWFQPVIANLHLGQAYLLMLALLTLAWSGVRKWRAGDSPAGDRGDRRLGLALGSLLLLKLAAPLLWLVPFIWRRWRALIWGALTALALGLLSLPWSGTAAWIRYGRLLLSLTGEPERAVTAYQTALGFFRHLFTVDPVWNPRPLFLAPALGAWLPWFASALLVGVSVLLVVRCPAADLAFAVFTILSVILSPLALDYHYALLLAPIALLVARARQASSTPAWLVLLAGCLLVGADLPYRSPRLADGWWALLAYPKLYGALLIWALALWFARQRGLDDPLPHAGAEVVEG